MDIKHKLTWELPVNRTRQWRSERGKRLDVYNYTHHGPHASRFSICQRWSADCSLTGIEGRKEMFYLTTHSTHFIYGYMASDIWLRTILIVRKETRCRHIGYSFRLTARVLLYAPSHRQDSTYHGLWYTSRGALAGTRNSSVGSPHEGSIRRPIASWANTGIVSIELLYKPLYETNNSLIIEKSDTYG